MHRASLTKLGGRVLEADLSTFDIGIGESDANLLTDGNFAAALCDNGRFKDKDLGVVIAIGTAKKAGVKLLADGILECHRFREVDGLVRHGASALPRSLQEARKLWQRVADCAVDLAGQPSLLIAQVDPLAAKSKANLAHEAVAQAPNWRRRVRILTRDARVPGCGGFGSALESEVARTA